MTGPELRYNLHHGPKLLYVGRVSKEKNLPLLGEVFHTISKDRPDIQLVIVGDGPYLAEFKELMEGTPTRFTGYLEGEELAGIYASCDLFVFPSTTDTFGNVVLEAQESGIPVIVTQEPVNEWDRGFRSQNSLGRQWNQSLATWHGNLPGCFVRIWRMG